MMKILTVFFFFTVLFYSSVTLARECRSCEEHRNGGSITYGTGYSPGGVYQSGGAYYPGYGGYPNRYNRYPGNGSITYTCGSGNRRGGHRNSAEGCVTRYQGPASDLDRLPKITRQIRQSQPRSFSNPWHKPSPQPYSHR